MLENCSTVIRTALTQKLMFNSLRRGTQRRKSIRKTDCGVTLEILEDRSLLSAGDLFVAELPQTTLINSDGLAPGVSGLLTEPASGDPLDIGLGYLRENAASLGLTAADLEDGDFNVTNRLRFESQWRRPHIFLDQVHNGVPLLNGNVSFSVTRDGEIISLSSSFIAGLDSSGTANEPTISAVDGYKSVAEYFSLEFTTDPELVYDGNTELISHAGAAMEDVPYTLEYAPTADGGIELAWRMNIQTLDSQHWYDVAVSAIDGEILQAGDWINSASYTALDLPFENPGKGHSQHWLIHRIPLPRRLAGMTQDGVAGAEFTDTRGNNVFAQEDQDANNTGGARPDGGAGLNFDFAFDPTQGAAQKRRRGRRSICFVQNNLIHDILYRYGFDEPIRKLPKQQLRQRRSRW